MKKLILVALLAVMADSAFCQSKSRIDNNVVKDTPVTSTSAFKVSFDYVFKRNFDGTFSPNFPVQINGEIMGAGAPFNKDQAFGGITVGAYEGHSLLIDTIGKVVVIRKFL